MAYAETRPDTLWRRDVRTDGKQLPEMATLLREHFSPNALRVLDREDDFRVDLFKADLGAMQVSTLAYNAGIELAVETADDHILVTTQLAGYETVRSRGHDARGGIGFVVIDSTPEVVTKRFSADSRRLNLRLDRRALAAYWRRAEGERHSAPRVFAPFVGADGAQRRWWSHVQTLLAYLESPPDPRVTGRVLAHIEEALMLYLLLEHPNDARTALSVPPPRAEDRRLVRAETYVRDHLREALSLAILAEAAGLSIRSLTAGFRAKHDLSPMKYVEALRLDAAHEALQRDRDSVTAIATDLGFSNLGRFSAAYARRFGRPPSATRRSA